MNEHAQLVLFCTRLGATPVQAEAMASQLSKRCDQWVVDRGIERTEAMATLLQMVLKGRNGETPAGFGATEPPRPPTSPPETR